MLKTSSLVKIFLMENFKKGKSNKKGNATLYVLLGVVLLYTVMFSFSFSMNFKMEREANELVSNASLILPNVFTITIMSYFFTLMSGNSLFNRFLFFSFVMFECYGLIDVCEFNVIPLLTFITLLISIAELENKRTENLSLPLFAVNRVY